MSRPFSIEAGLGFIKLHVAFREVPSSLPLPDSTPGLEAPTAVQAIHNIAAAFAMFMQLHNPYGTAFLPTNGFSARAGCTDYADGLNRGRPVLYITSPELSPADSEEGTATLVVRPNGSSVTIARTDPGKQYPGHQTIVGFAMPVEVARRVGEVPQSFLADEPLAVAIIGPRGVIAQNHVVVPRCSNRASDTFQPI